MRARSAALAVAALALLAIALPRESGAYPTVEGQPAQYVIFTSDALAASFQPLADWKTQTGLPAVVRRMSDVIAAHPVAVDDAERLRLDIRDAWLAGARWVLLGGGVGVVPHRYAHTAFFGGRDLLCDLYFQCLDGNWDGDGDHIFGEGSLGPGTGDNADLVPEVWLGRAPVLTAEEATRFVAKTLQYERTPSGDYEQESLECAEVLFPRDWTPGSFVTLDGAELVEPLLPRFDLHPSLHVTRLYENFSDPRWRPDALPETRDSVLEALNAGANQALIVGFGTIHTVGVGPGTIDESDFLGLANGGRLLSLRILGSSAAQFDSGGIGTAALLAPAGGAACVVGASDFEFPSSERVVMEEYYRLMYQDSVTAQGEAVARSCQPLLPFTSFDGVHRMTVMTQTLLGDPELRAWTGPLRALAVTHAPVALVRDDLFDVTVSANGAPLEGARVAAWSPGQFLGVAITDAGGVAHVPIHPAGRGSFRLTVTAYDARPAEESVRVVGSERMRSPAAHPVLELRVMGPRPIGDAPEVELALATAAPARLEVLDLAGRRMTSREIAGAGPGAVTLRLDAAARLAPGVYWLRLTQGAASTRTRMVVLR